MLAISDTESLAPARFAGVNVAVQGLLTVELLLFGDEPPLADRKHCALLTAIAHNLHNMAADILADWSVGGGGFATVVASAGPTNAQFASHKEATLAFFKSLHDGLQLLAEARIKPVLGGSLAEAQPRFAESRLSGRALRNIVINLKAFQGLYGDVANPGLGAITQNVDPKLDRLLRKAFRVDDRYCPIDRAAARRGRRRHGAAAAGGETKDPGGGARADCQDPSVTDARPCRWLQRA